MICRVFFFRHDGCGDCAKPFFLPKTQWILILAKICPEFLGFQQLFLPLFFNKNIDETYF